MEFHISRFWGAQHILSKITPALSSGMRIYSPPELWALCFYGGTSIFTAFSACSIIFSHSGCDPCSGFQSWFAQLKPRGCSCIWGLTCSSGATNQSPILWNQVWAATSASPCLQHLQIHSLSFCLCGACTMCVWWDICAGAGTCWAGDSATRILVWRHWNQDPSSLETLKPGPAGSGHVGTKIFWVWKCWNQGLIV